MYTVHQLMLDRGVEAYSVTPGATVLNALQLMAEKNVGAVMVVERGKIMGIFSERDFARKSTRTGKCSLDARLADVMTQEMITIHPDQTLEECMSLMKRHHIRHLPVMSEGRLVGMVSMRDVLDAILSMKDSTIEDLKSYIFGEEYGR